MYKIVMLVIAVVAIAIAAPGLRTYDSGHPDAGISIDNREVKTLNWDENNHEGSQHLLGVGDGDFELRRKTTEVPVELDVITPLIKVKVNSVTEVPNSSNLNNLMDVEIQITNALKEEIVHKMEFENGKDKSEEIITTVPEEEEHEYELSKLQEIVPEGEINTDLAKYIYNLGLYSVEQGNRRRIIKRNTDPASIENEDTLELKKVVSPDEIQDEDQDDELADEIID